MSDSPIESTKGLHESKERKPEPETGGELLDAETEREMTEYGALCGAMGYCDPAALRRHLIKLRDRFDERLRREQERQSVECCVQCGEPKNRTNQAGDEVANGWPHCVNPSCVAFGQSVASASYRRVGLSRGAEPEMTLKMTRERLNEKIQSDPDLETEAGILHPEAPRADFRTALDLFGDAKFALGAWSGAHAAHGGKPYSELNDAANAAFDRVMEMVPPRGEAETPTDTRKMPTAENVEISYVEMEAFNNPTNGKQGFILSYGLKGVGFGEFVFVRHPDGRYVVDNEMMRREWVRRVLNAFLDKCELKDANAD